ncbi:MAG: GGDEF domain-containing protein, partial [Patescibacteria group bacterium]|nr:GGDEF domain-containing protein [Patescibacteria group bacterium]
NRYHFWGAPQGVKEGDVVARYGGEEFSILLEGVGEHEAEEIVERLRKTIDGIVMTNVKDIVKPKMSFGVAVMEKSEDPENCLSRADQALYQAKKEGKNRVKVFTEGNS